MKNQIDNGEYEVELLSSRNLADQLQISVIPTISGNKVTVKILAKLTTVVAIVFIVVVIAMYIIVS